MCRTASATDCHGNGDNVERQPDLHEAHLAVTPLWWTMHPSGARHGERRARLQHFRDQEGSRTDVEALCAGHCDRHGQHRMALDSALVGSMAIA
jgi:hypothetical protein